MDKQNLMPIAAQPVNRITTGQPLPLELAELSEEALSLDEIGASYAAMSGNSKRQCSYDGDDAE